MTSVTSSLAQKIPNMTHPVKTPKKLIEVALPLDAINTAAAREKSIRHGHPSTLHLWWARRPLAAARAVIFAQLVNDPSWRWELEHSEEIPPNNLKASWAASRKRLFSLLEDLVKWENTTNEEVLEKARAEIRKSWRETCDLNKDHPQAAELFNPEKLPAFHDPFAGGGALPLEAQRLGLEAYASDLNPVAVLINKAMIEIPPKFAGRPPVNPETKIKKDLVGRDWQGAQGLAEDVRYYGQWMRDEAQKRIGHLYPKVEVTAEMAKDRPDLKPLIAQKLTVVAWLWTRTVKCPNPACGTTMPLLSSFILSSKKGKGAYLVPKLGKNGELIFDVSLAAPEHLGDLSTGFKRGMSGIFECIRCKTVTTRNYTADQACQVGLGSLQTAIVCESKSGRVYLPVHCGAQIPEIKIPDTTGLKIELSPNPRDVWCRNFGLNTPADLFTPRQLVALTTFSDLVTHARDKVRKDAEIAGMPDDAKGLDAGGTGAIAYADAVAVYLGMAISKMSDTQSALCRWKPTMDQSIATFGRQTLPMVWDYSEANVFGGMAGDPLVSLKNMMRVVDQLPARIPGFVNQVDAQTQSLCARAVVSTDPPYYDNIGYADLSDFFYVWLRRSLRTIFPSLFATMAVPKAEELVALTYRHGKKDKAESFFLDGMTRAMHNLASQAHPAVPVTIYYAFKQSETKTETGTASTGWETFLDAVLRAGFALTGTWPMRTELDNRLVGKGTNALASSIVLVCRPRPHDAATTSRRAFQRELNQVLPEALDEMTRGSDEDRSPVAPVDLSQAIIGPGMAVFSKYSAVLEADGTPMNVRTALQLINRFLAEDDFDHDTQFCLHWFEQHGWKEGKFGDAETLSRAKGTSVEGVKQAGVLFAAGGVVRLLKWADYPTDWDPATDQRLPVWEALHHLIRVFKTEGETGAGTVLSAIQAKAEASRQLAYRLFTLCERAGWSEDARAYDELVKSWSAIESAAAKVPGPLQATLFG